MSHSAVVSLENNKKNWTNNCNEIINQIKSINVELVGKAKEDIENSIREVQNLQKQIDSLPNIVEINISLKITSDISHQIKIASNIINNIDFINNIYEKASINAQKEISKLIIENGKMATIAIQEINNNEILTPHLLSIKIEELRNKKVSDTIFDEFKKKIQNKLINSSFPKRYQEQIYKFAMKNNTSQLMNDWDRWFLAQEIKAKEIKQIFNEEIYPAAKLSGYSISKDGIHFDKNNNLEIRAQLKDKEAGEIDLIFTSDLRIKYKTGNYSGHICHTKANELLNNIKKERRITDYKIIEDFSNESPLHKEYKYKEGK